MNRFEREQTTPAAKAIALIQRAVAGGASLTDAAITFKVEYPSMALRIMETIGSYPSSEPELRALQRVW